jgi:hypothetical protein
MSAMRRLAQHHHPGIANTIKKWLKIIRMCHFMCVLAYDLCSCIAFNRHTAQIPMSHEVKIEQTNAKHLCHDGAGSPHALTKYLVLYFVN